MLVGQGPVKAPGPGGGEDRGGLRAIIPQKDKKPKLDLRKIPREEWDNLIQDLTNQMNLASANLLFEEAADLRDQIVEIRKRMVK